ncbi:hypothetical protein Zmor_021350 [Zophobas morio]|uniref:Uncharacterized protein n=1 Tax=Zophobas morio TaxID=2755281 RepID=A0AA38I9B9_9CUCU|nr:hypothetical protein Zmor_021350 [Zophobas morio]
MLFSARSQQRFCGFQDSTLPYETDLPDARQTTQATLVCASRRSGPNASGSVSRYVEAFPHAFVIRPEAHRKARVLTSSRLGFLRATARVFLLARLELFLRRMFVEATRRPCNL